MRIREFGIDLNRSFELGDCVFDVALLCKRAAKAAAQVGRVGIKLHRLLVFGNGGVGFLAPPARAHVHMDEVVFGFNSNALWN